MLSIEQALRRSTMEAKPLTLPHVLKLSDTLDLYIGGSGQATFREEKRDGKFGTWYSMDPTLFLKVCQFLGDNGHTFASQIESLYGPEGWDPMKQPRETHATIREE
jgi:hypothetical protein